MLEAGQTRLPSHDQLGDLILAVSDSRFDSEGRFGALAGPVITTLAVGVYGQFCPQDPSEESYWSDYHKVQVATYQTNVLNEERRRSLWSINHQLNPQVVLGIMANNDGIAPSLAERRLENVLVESRQEDLMDWLTLFYFGKIDGAPKKFLGLWQSKMLAVVLGQDYLRNMFEGWWEKHPPVLTRIDLTSGHVYDPVESLSPHADLEEIRHHLYLKYLYERTRKVQKHLVETSKKINEHLYRIDY